ncbi:MAG: PilZ domain-containing protein [Armatimonadota bacterium]
MAVVPGTDAAWGEAMLRAMAEALGNRHHPPKDGDLQRYRRECATHGKRFPDEIADGEAAIEIAGRGFVEGICLNEGAVTRFLQTDEPALLPPGAEVRLRTPSGALRCLVLRNERDALLLARAPNRCERRRHPRHPVSGVAVVRIAGTERECSLRDISEGGLCAASEHIIEVGEPIAMFLRVAGLQELAFEADGIVANCRADASGSGYQLGVAFTDLPDDLRSELARMNVRSSLS